MQIHKASDTNHDPWVNMLLQGFPGSGKSTFGARCAVGGDGHRILVVLTEAWASRIVSQANPGVEYVTPGSWDEVKEAYKYLRDHEGDFDAVVLDSVDDLQQMYIDELLRSKRKKSPSIEDWLNIKFSTFNLLRAFRDLPMSTVFLTKTKETAVEASSDERARIVVRPMIYGSDSDHRLLGMVHLGGFCYVVPGATSEDPPSYRVMFRSPGDRYLLKATGAVKDDYNQNDVSAIMVAANSAAASLKLFSFTPDGEPQKETKTKAKSGK